MREQVAREMLHFAKALLAEGDKKPVDKRYQQPDGEFKEMKPPGGGKANKFEGCVKYMMNTKGLPRENAEKLCGWIKKNVAAACCGRTMDYDRAARMYVAAQLIEVAKELSQSQTGG